MDLFERLVVFKAFVCLINEVPEHFDLSNEGLQNLLSFVTAMASALEEVDIFALSERSSSVWSQVNCATLAVKTLLDAKADGESIEAMQSLKSAARQRGRSILATLGIAVEASPALQKRQDSLLQVQVQLAEHGPQLDKIAHGLAGCVSGAAGEAEKLHQMLEVFTRAAASLPQEFVGSAGLALQRFLVDHGAKLLATDLAVAPDLDGMRSSYGVFKLAATTFPANDGIFAHVAAFADKLATVGVADRVHCVRGAMSAIGDGFGEKSDE